MDEEAKTEQRFDEVKCPAHYAGDGEVECKRAMRSMAAGYDKSTASTACRYWAIAAFKYLWRFPLKGRPLEDLKKARECIDLAIEACETGKKPSAYWVSVDAIDGTFSTIGDEPIQGMGNKPFSGCLHFSGDQESFDALVGEIESKASKSRAEKEEAAE